jgi:hypothetical protein
MFCPECGTLMISSDGRLKCRKCGYIRKFQADDQTDLDSTEDLFFCFCHRYRCVNKDYSSCPKNCENQGPKNRCKIKCQLKQKNPEKCEKIVYQLQLDRGEKPKHISGYEI